MGFYFCSLPCWEAHVPMMRHRDAWAEVGEAPSRAEFEAQKADVAAKAASRAEFETRKAETEAGPPSSNASSTRRRVMPDTMTSSVGLPKDILVVASKLKKYIRAQSGMNTSEDALSVLSEHLRRLCNEAIRNAGADGRKTVKGRDFPPAR